MTLKLLFWGYLDDQGKITVKRYTDDRTIRNFEQMPWVKGIFDPFYCKDIWEARLMMEMKYKELN
jgi:hypothetical protein